MVGQLSSSIPVSASTGYPLPQYIGQLALQLKAQLDNQLTNAGAISSCTVSIPPNQNVLSTATLNVTIGIVPLGYIKTINVTIQFVNPAIQQVQQAGVSP